MSDRATPSELGYIREALGRLAGTLGGVEETLKEQARRTEALSAAQLAISDRLESRLAGEVRLNRDERLGFERAVNEKLTDFGEKLDALEERSKSSEATLKRLLSYATVGGGIIAVAWMAIGPAVQEAVKSVFGVLKH